MTLNGVMTADSFYHCGSLASCKLWFKTIYNVRQLCSVGSSIVLALLYTECPLADMKRTMKRGAEDDVGDNCSEEDR